MLTLKYFPFGFYELGTDMHNIFITILDNVYKGMFFF